MTDLARFIKWYEDMGKDAWKVCGSLEAFIAELIAYYRSMQEFKLEWEIPPTTDLDKLHFRTPSTIEIRCVCGNATATATVSIFEFPIDKGKQEYIETALKRKCVFVLHGLDK
jgi:hypothetical protein